MNKKILVLLAVMLSAMGALAQSQQIINGDLNHDGKLDVSDLSAISGMILGDKSIEYIDMNKVDNSLIQGTWYITKSNNITFNADGTTNCVGGSYKYEYYPYKGQVFIYNADGSLKQLVTVVKLTNEELILTKDGSTFTTYTKTQPAQPVTAIKLSETSLTLAVNSFKTLTATVLPADADNSAYTWSSSDESVAKVTSDGMVLALSHGFATITATAQDGSGVTGKCEVSVVAATTSSVKTYTVNGVSFNMVSVAGGTFQMGATSEQGTDAYANETPVHTVTVSDFSIGETEVTQALWYAVMKKRPTDYSYHQWNYDYGLGDNYPSYEINYDDCLEFISKLNQLTGEKFRLPTEAEWEFAARGGNLSKGYKYSGSDNYSDVMWYVSGKNNKHEVAAKAPNELGLYDMSGSVGEWCSDWFGLYTSEAQTNPTGPSSGESRVFRDYKSYPRLCRVSYRGKADQDTRTECIGLRLAR